MTTATGFSVKIVLVEQAAATQRNPHRLEIPSRNRVDERALVFLGASVREQLEPHAVTVEVAAEWQLAREGGRVDRVGCVEPRAMPRRRTVG